MTTGRPDFWYGQVFLLEDTPTDGTTDKAPTSNWAYDHEQTGVHVANQPSDPGGEIAAHAALTATHGVTTIDGVTERNAAITTHTAIAAAHHARYTDAEAKAACLPAIVDRGDVGEIDFNLGAAYWDGNWHDLDLSSIVGINSKFVLLRIRIKDNANGSNIYLRKKGAVMDKQQFQATIQTADIPFCCEALVPMSAMYVIEILTTATTWTYIYITVAGWSM